MDPFTMKEIAEAASDAQGSDIPDFKNWESQGDSFEKSEGAGFDDLGDNIPDFKNWESQGDSFEKSEGAGFDDLGDNIPDFGEPPQNPPPIVPKQFGGASEVSDPVPMDAEEDNQSDGVEQDNNENSEAEKNSDSGNDTAASQEADGAGDKTESEDRFVDDNGKVFKDPEGNLLPNVEYEINGIKYKTDDHARISSWDGDLTASTEERDNDAQSEVGGDDRLADDHGGHLVANMNGGSSGNENLVPMRGHLNQGDYKKGEIEENNMLKEGKTVHESGTVSYEGDSMRPSIIEKTYTDGEKTVEAKYDNKEGSTELLSDIKDDISSEDYDSLSEEISDMQADGNEVSVTSVVKEYDSNGKLTSVTVGYRNETTGRKSYIQFTPNAGANNAANSY